MRKKYILLSMTLLAVTIQAGCNQKVENVPETKKEQTLEIPILENNIENEEVANSNQVDNIDEAFKEKWIKATCFIQEELRKVPGANENISKEETDAQFDELVKDIENGLQDEAQVYYRLCSIIASMKHIHMSLNYLNQEDYPKGEYVKLDVLWTQEGLVVCSADEACKESVGLFLTKINGYSVAEIMDKYATIRGQETEAGKKSCVWGLYSADLKYLGIMKENDESIVLTLKDEKGEEREIVYTFGSKESSTWYSILDTADLPFTYQLRLEKGSDNYNYIGKSEDGIMYFQYLVCQDGVDKPFDSFFKEMITKMQEQDDIYDTLVIDVRWNGGGNRYLLQKCLIENKEYLKKKHIRIIIGDCTASAGVQVIEDCITFFDDVLLYGSPTCGAIHNYTEIMNIAIPETGLNLCVPTVKDNLPKLVHKYGDIVDSVVPDVPVEISLHDFIEGKDTIYDRVLKDKCNSVGLE